MKPTLPTNYKDDILNTSVEGMRRYQMIYNSDNTVSFKDVTPYDQTGSDFGAGDINLTNKAVNQSADAEKIIDDPDTAEATTEEGYIAGVQLFNHVNDSLGGLQFGVDENGNYGYIKAGADSVTPFSSGSIYAYANATGKNTTALNFKNYTISQAQNDLFTHSNGVFTFKKSCKIIAIIGTASGTSAATCTGQILKNGSVVKKDTASTSFKNIIYSATMNSGDKLQMQYFVSAYYFYGNAILIAS